MQESLAEYIVRMRGVWERTSKETINNNIKLLFGENKTLRKNRDTTRLDTLHKITGVSKHTINAWMNSSRIDVKIPFEKLCEICAELHIDLESMLSDKEDWHEVVDSDEIEIFEKLRSIQIYHDGWDFDFLLESIEDITDNKSKDNVERMAIDYLLIVIGLEENYVYESIRRV